jgi:hypothetical protein
MGGNRALKKFGEHLYQPRRPAVSAILVLGVVVRCFRNSPVTNLLQSHQLAFLMPVLSCYQLVLL